MEKGRNTAKSMNQDHTNGQGRSFQTEIIILGFVPDPEDQTKGRRGRLLKFTGKGHESWP